MAFMIKPKETTYFPKRKSPKNAGYLAFLRKLPCCVTGSRPVEAAHISFADPYWGHYGRARGTKAPDRWALPLSPEEHRKQHSGSEHSYWENLGYSPHSLALALWGLYTEMSEDAEEFAIALIMGRVMRGE